MTGPGQHDDKTSTRTGRSDPPPSRTDAGARTTARMAGTEPLSSDADHRLVNNKTSAAAVFSLVFGLAALFCALTAILSPAAVLFAVIGIVLGIIGLKMAKRPGITGRGVAIGGLVTSVLGLLLGATILAGATAIVNDEQRLDDLQQRIENLRDDLPSTGEVREELPGG